MKFDHLFLAGNLNAIPKPEVYFDSNEQFLIVAVPWGSRAGVSKAIETISEYYLSSKGDHEITSPFARLTNLSTTANNLRIAALLANEVLYEDINRQEYTLGLEIFIGSFSKNELVWVQIGRPHICLSRSGRAIASLSTSLDLSAEISAPSKIQPPLPSELFGLDQNPNLHIRSFCPRSGDQLYLVIKDWLPSSFFALGDSRRDLNSVSEILRADSTDSSWIGCWQL